MKKIKLLVLLYSLLLLIGCSKDETEPTVELEFTPSFSSVVVKNIDASKQWYQALLGLTVKSTVNDATFKVVILESPGLTIELLELSNSLVPQDLLTGQPAGTQLQGHFKYGYTVPNMDACIEKLADLNVPIPQIWTDPETEKRNFLISDPDGNLIQFFEQ